MKIALQILSVIVAAIVGGSGMIAFMVYAFSNPGILLLLIVLVLVFGAASTAALGMIGFIQYLRGS